MALLFVAIWCRMSKRCHCKKPHQSPGNRMSEFVASMFAATGKLYLSSTSSDTCGPNFGNRSRTSAPPIGLGAELRFHSLNMRAFRVIWPKLSPQLFD
jgi:hypothetical protein